MQRSTVQVARSFGSHAHLRGGDWVKQMLLTYAHAQKKGNGGQNGNFKAGPQAEGQIIIATKDKYWVARKVLIDLPKLVQKIHSNRLLQS